MRTIDEAIARMQDLDATLPLLDGVAWFNKMYLVVTQDVAAAIRAGRFEDGDFLESLDVDFAGLYFQAYDAWCKSPDAAPKAWSPLFEARADKRVAPLQFAIAGMSAHINRDLAVAVVASGARVGWAPARETPRYRDFVRVGEILQAAEARVKTWFSTGFVHAVDVALGQAADVAALWSVRQAREAAFTHAEVLWSLRDVPSASDAYVATLDRLVGFAGRALLLPGLAA